MCRGDDSHGPRPVGKRVPLDPPAFTRLEDVRARTLVLVGSEDMLSFQSLAKVAATRIPRAREVVVRGVAHMISMERPRLFDRLVLEFVEAGQADFDAQQ